MHTLSQNHAEQLTRQIQEWSRALGFQQLGISGIDLSADEALLNEWLALGRHGDMDYMQRHGSKRSRPDELVPGTLRVISARMDYLGEAARDSSAVMSDPTLGFISRYALGRDYHKLMRQRLQKLAAQIEQEIGEFGYRVFVDSAPVLEKALARNAGLGWIGKHTNLINRKAGSWFFLGEIYTDLPLSIDAQQDSDHCGKCSACIDVCPTAAIVAPYQVDARRCISYLTIELRTAIPEEYRPLLGNRIYGCDDCQLVCPWNRFAALSAEKDFLPRHGLDNPSLLTLFAWSEAEFLHLTEGSAIRRIGYECWLRNIAVALGNGPASPDVISALQARLSIDSELVREHVQWALESLSARQA
jgi:epoxyqueuosine reductase